MPVQWMSEADAWAFLIAAEDGRLATVDADGQPFITPVNHAIHEDRIYFHSNERGRKIANLRANPRVCFEVSRCDRLIITPEKVCGCTTRYTSVLAFGEARVLEDAAEKAAALNLLVGRYTGGRPFAQVGEREAKTCAVVAIRVDQISGKRNVDPS